ncbi:MAG: LCP family protein [Clostridia bacterium]|nr:LCP family protein [Clostridia bacterium]
MKTTFHISRKTWRSVFIVIGVLLLGALMIVGVHYLELWHDRKAPVNGNGGDTNGNNAINSNNSDAPQYYSKLDGRLYTLKQNVETILFIGLDVFDDSNESDYLYRNDKQADMVLLAVIDHDRKEYSLVQLNRDTMVSFNTIGDTGAHTGKITAQLALAHTYGSGKLDSCNNVKDAVEYLFYGDVKIDHVMSLKMDAISILNDAVGGVTVELLDDFSYRYEGFEQGATVTLYGNQATDYVRERGALDNKTNINRMKRQRQYLAEWRKALLEATKRDSAVVTTMFEDASPYLFSNLDTAEIQSFANVLETYTATTEVKVPDGTSEVVDGYMQFKIDDAALERMVLDLFYVPVDTDN